MNEKISTCKHAIHYLNLVYHRRFFSPRRCNTDARGIIHHLPSLPIAYFAPQVNLVGIEQYKRWLEDREADSEITYLGKRLDLSDLSKRNPLDTSVTYCTDRIDNLCGGSCTSYNGGPTCLAAPGTSCLFATNNVGF